MSEITLNGWQAICFAIIVLALLINYGSQPNVIEFKCPDSCLGVVRIEGENAFETVNLRTGRNQEWRFEDKPPIVPGGLFAGYVLGEIRFTEQRGYQKLDENGPDLPYHIVRGKDLYRDFAKYADVALVTKEDGMNRPVLAKNCYNVNEDTDVACEGGDAVFTKGGNHAEPTGPIHEFQHYRYDGR